MKSLRIVFMGTPEFAVESLSILNKSAHDIVGVVTVPDKPAGRGKKLRASAVKEYALEHSLPLAQPEKLRSEDFLAQLDIWNADLYVVVAFRMLPQIVWQKAPKGTINLHGSFLPQYRGAAPINWAVINGEKETGVTTFFINEHIDTGSVIEQSLLPIGPNETAGELHDRMMVIGAQTLLHTVNTIALDQAEPTVQSELIQNPNLLKPAPKLFREDCRIDWHQTNQHVHNLVRGLSPYPAAWTLWEGKTVKVYRTEMIDTQLQPGQVDTDQKSYLHVGCEFGSVSIVELQMEGKKRMSVEEFLRGTNIQSGLFLA
ncbi:MAG: methionyl-tRNA formyltransferase [Flavobacteriales bacterium]|nr:methionyl-tRNA formyltransferase [Flavobacteriales bacterium]